MEANFNTFLSEQFTPKKKSINGVIKAAAGTVVKNIPWVVTELQISPDSFQTGWILNPSATSWYETNHKLHK